MPDKWIVFILILLIISQTPTIGNTIVIMLTATTHTAIPSGYL